VDRPRGALDVQGSPKGHRPVARSLEVGVSRWAVARSSRAALVLLITALLSLATVPPAVVARADQEALQGVALTRALEAGGLVVVLRHAETDQSHPDRTPVVLADCATQRNLDAAGRADARAIGRAARTLRLRVGAVLASPYCRTLETARLAFGRATGSRALLNTFGVPDTPAHRRQVRQARGLIGRAPLPGRLTVLVTHGSVIEDATGQTVAEGEALVVRPRGAGRFTVLGRLLPAGWTELARRQGSSETGPRVHEYPVPAGSHPHDVAPAPDGSVWYTAQRTGRLGRLDPRTGRVVEIPLGAGSAPHGVIVGPDGAAWVTDGGLNAIVRVSPRARVVRVFPLPPERAGANLNTATFDRQGNLWFTGQSGVYGRLDPRTGRMRVFSAPLGPGPYGITTTPSGAIFYASLAGSHIARIDLRSGRARVLRPPTPGQGARRVWSDSRGRIWVSEWNAGRLAMYDPARARWREWRVPGAQPQPYAVFVDDRDAVWLSDFGGNALVRFDPARLRFQRIPLPTAAAEVRQLLGRPGEVWGAESGTDRLVVVRTR
jgi:virginiamycin B lyase